MNRTEFNDLQYKNIYDESMQFHYWNLYRNNYLLKIIREFDLNNFLDIGCGRGLVTGFIQRNGVEIQGVELGNTTKLDSVSANILYNTNALDLDNSLKIDTISLFDVIEHIEKPIDFLSQLILHFKNVKNILITVPARQELWSNFDEFNGHFKRYNINDLDNDLQKLNCRMVYKSYFFQLLYYMILVNNKIFQKKRVIDYSRKKPMGQIEKFVHRTFSSFMKIERLFFPNSSRGSSIVYLLEIKR